VSTWPLQTQVRKLGHNTIATKLWLQTARISTIWTTSWRQTHVGSIDLKFLAVNTLKDLSSKISTVTTLSSRIWPITRILMNKIWQALRGSWNRTLMWILVKQTGLLIQYHLEQVTMLYQMPIWTLLMQSGKITTQFTLQDRACMLLRSSSKISAQVMCHRTRPSSSRLTQATSTTICRSGLLFKRARLQRIKLCSKIRGKQLPMIETKTHSLQ